jgi:hypothetical protein
MFFSTKAIKYFCGLNYPGIPTSDVGLINPYSSNHVQSIVKRFFSKYYNDNRERLFIIGINPGRFGGGLTGISFTDPVALREACGIENILGNRKELSSKFIYTVAEIFGGAEKFFSKVFLTAIYPFAIIKNGKNYNYYDEKLLAEKLRSEIIKNIKSQISFGARKNFAVLLGKKNAEFFAGINEEHKFFQRIAVLEHPRYIMQYQLKKINYYTTKYIETINQ